jgi:Mg/Co/Ni transporter MgtE
MRTLESLVRTFVETHPKDAANALEQVDMAEAIKILDRLPSRLNGLLLERLTPQKAGAVLQGLERSRAHELLAGVSGAAIPIVLRALKRDPAQSSSIFLTTVTDVVGFASFLGFAAAFMPLLVG